MKFEPPEGNLIALLYVEKNASIFPSLLVTSVNPHSIQSLTFIIICDCSCKEATISQTILAG